MQNRALIPKLTLQSFEQAFEIEYTHNSTAIEGNTLTLMETELVLEDGITVGGKNLREIYEQVNHQKVYRSVDVYISGAQHTPPSPNEMYRQIKNFYADLTWKSKELNLIELAAWTHAEFMKIHPFPDGNGRTSRLIMNYQLMASGFPAIDVKKENRLEYFNTLEAYAVEDNLTPFAELIGALAGQQLDRYLGMIEQAQGMQQQSQSM